ncbi:MAG: DUF1521 domain-containing protein [Planctomycetes bacterium]|nr:DUF1521 domain-containing protein [Planctomycetota bacterium]
MKLSPNFLRLAFPTVLPNPAMFIPHGHKHGHKCHTMAPVAPAPPACPITKNGNTVSVGNYDITARPDGFDIVDRTTGKSIKASGDPHVSTSDGDRMQFQKDNLTFDLPNGVKITLVPTAANGDGISYLDKAAIMTRNQAVVISNIHGNPTVGDIQTNPATVDAQFADGTVLRAGGELDDLFTTGANAHELIGGDANARWGERMLDGLGGASQYRFDAAPAAIGATPAAGLPTGNVTDFGSDAFNTSIDNISSQIGSVEKELDSVMNDKNLSDTEKNAKSMKLQMKETMLIQQLQRVYDMFSNKAKTIHDAEENVIRNMRS